MKHGDEGTNGLSRRRFIIGSGMAGIGALGIGLVGCGEDDEEAPAGGSPVAGTPTAAGGAAAELAKIKGDTTGVTDTEVVIGSTVPKTGPAAVYAPMIAAWSMYFDDVNKRGGIAGRQVKLIIEDDGYNPSNTVNVTKKLVEQDQVFMTFCGFGGAHQLAVLDYLKQRGVPQLFLIAPEASWATAGPTVLAMWPESILEGTVLGTEIADKHKGKKWGILRTATDSGKEFRDGLIKGVGTALTLVGEETFESSTPDITSQALKLINSGAEVLAVSAISTQLASVLKNVKAQGKTIAWYSAAGGGGVERDREACGGRDGRPFH